MTVYCYRNRNSGYICIMKCKLLLTAALLAFAFGASAQYNQDFSTNKKTMEDSCWVFVNSNINASIGNNKNYVTGALTTDASLTSPFYAFFNTKLTFAYRSEDSGVNMVLIKISDAGDTTIVRNYSSCPLAYVTDTVTLDGLYKLRWLFKAHNNDRGYIDYITMNSGFFNASLSNCQPYVFLGIGDEDKDDKPVVVRKKAGQPVVKITSDGNVTVAADVYSVRIYTMSGTCISKTDNAPTVVPAGIYVVVVTYTDTDGASENIERFKVLKN